MTRATSSSASTRSRASTPGSSLLPGRERISITPAASSYCTRPRATGGRMTYRISRSTAAGSSGSTTTELWTENPLCRHESSNCTRSWSINPRFCRNDRTWCRKTFSAAPGSVYATATHEPSFRHPPRLTIACTCGWKFTRSPKVCTTATIPGRIGSPAPADQHLAHGVPRRPAEIA